MQYLYILNSF